MVGAACSAENIVNEKESRSTLKLPCPGFWDVFGSHFVATSFFCTAIDFGTNISQLEFFVLIMQSELKNAQCAFVL